MLGLLTLAALASCCLTVSATDFDTIASRKRADIAVTSIQSTSAASTLATYDQLPAWISTLSTNGTWADVTYVTGCDADTAIWTAELHLQRVVGLGQAWSGLNSAIPQNYTNSSVVFATAQKALNWWFLNDYNVTACLTAGGTTTCPCGTAGLWNKNWWFQGIGVPTLVSEACLLLYPGNLTDYQRSKCLEIGIRGSTFSSQVLPAVDQTAANLVNIMQSVISAAIYSGNATLLAQAYSTGMGVFAYVDTASTDGIHRDGSFLQHTGQLYNGAYGREFIKSFIQLQSEAVGTVYAANSTTEDVMATLIRGSDWQIFTGDDDVLYWDLSVIGRYIASPRSDALASAGLEFNVSSLAAAVGSWTGANDVTADLARLEQASGAVALSGNKAFWAGDYMVHRRDNFVLYNKMISNRSRNAEYTNGENPLGYHVNQGMLWSWVTGGEYQDITGAWDWYLVPGSTVLYHYPTLNSTWIAVTGKKNFVGVVSDGTNGLSVMDYIDPHDGSISYRRAWFYFGDLVINSIVNASRLTTASTAPIVTVLDQRLGVSGGVLDINGTARSSTNVTSLAARSLSYGGNGYFSYSVNFNLTTNEAERTGNWSTLSVSTAGPVTKDIFTAYATISNGSSLSYGFMPDTTSSALAAQVSAPTMSPLPSTQVLGVAGNNTLALSFWPDATKFVNVALATTGWVTNGSVTVTTSQPAIYIINKTASGGLVVNAADPTQSLTSMTLQMTSITHNFTCGTVTACISVTNGVRMTFTLPTGGLAGSTIATAGTIGLV